MTGITVETAGAGTGRPPDEAEVMEALDDVRRRIRAHAGDIEVVSISDDGDVVLAFTGTCVACPAQAMTVGAAVMPAMEKIAGVNKVSVRGMSVSPAVIERIRTMFG